MSYVGRFAPSPSGPLHAGSLVAAMGSYLDARVHDGTWLLRIEDVDTPRTVRGAAAVIMQQLAALGMAWDGEVVRQSDRGAAYQAALDHLARLGLLYGCGCTRREITQAGTANGAIAADGERPYPGTCRNGRAPGRVARAWRLRVPDGIETFHDRLVGWQEQNVALDVGDFALLRADGLWAYQLAVVVDDAAQSVTDVVRGADLLSSTARQRTLGRLLGVDLPRTMHLPLVTDPVSGLKLSKQNHAPALDTSQPVPALQAAWLTLGFEPFAAGSVPAFWSQAASRWAARFTMDRIGGPE